MNVPSTKSASKPACHRDDALAVLRRLRGARHVAYFAGGCVRDELLGLAPMDYDVATDAPPARVRELFGNTQAVGAAFGVILVHHARSVIEVATFRSDGVYLDGRRPADVHFTTAEEDAKRRDFTINGLFLDPIENRVIDFVGGQVDLKSRVLRAIGEPAHRFEEDHLRLLRAVRFAARFDLVIEPATAAAIKRHAEHLKRISPERIAEELRMLITPSTRIKAYQLLREFGLDRIILRFIPAAGDPVGVFSAIDEPSIPFGLALAALVLDAYGGRIVNQPEIGKASAAFRQALKISNDECVDLEGALNFGHLLADPPPTVASMKRFLAKPTSKYARILMTALARLQILRAQIDPLLEKLRSLEMTEVAPPPLVTGDDLTGAGLKPGKLFKRILDEVYDAQLESRINSKKEAMELAMNVARAS